MAKNLHSIHATDVLIPLAEKLPDNLMFDAEDAEGRFTFAFLQRLSDEQLAELKEAAELHKDENVFLFFYTRHQGKCEPVVELKNFESFDLSKILGISFNGHTAPLLSYSDLPPIYYVSVTFDVA